MKRARYLWYQGSLEASIHVGMLTGTADTPSDRDKKMAPLVKGNGTGIWGSGTSFRPEEVGDWMDMMGGTRWENKKTLWPNYLSGMKANLTAHTDGFLPHRLEKVHCFALSEVSK